MNCHIAPYVHAPPEQGNPERNRKLLLHEDEMQRIAGKLTMAGLTLVPLRIHLRNGWIKVQVALAKGKSTRGPPRNHQAARSRPRGPGGAGVGSPGPPVFTPAPPAQRAQPRMAMGAEARVTVGLHRSGQRSPTKYPPDESATNEPEVTDLTEELGVWDGKSTAALQSIYLRDCADDDFVATTLVLVADVNLQRAATWMLKRHLELGNPLSARECRSILGSLSVLQDWESKLHLLQCLLYLSIADEDRPGLEQFPDACVRSDKKFVRAWAYSGYKELALRFPQYREAVDGHACPGRRVGGCVVRRGFVICAKGAEPAARPGRSFGLGPAQPP